MDNENFGNEEEIIVYVDEDGNEVILKDNDEVGEETVIFEVPSEELQEEVYEEVYEETYAEEPIEEELYETEVQMETAHTAGKSIYEEEPAMLEDEDDGYEYDDDDEGGVLANVGNKLIYILAGLIAIIAICVGIFLFAGKKPTVKEVDFSTIGNNVAQIGIIGEDNINKITETEANRLDVLYEAVKNYDYDEADAESGITTVSVTLTSILKDLKIKFVNSKGKLIAKVPFEVEVTGPNGTYTWTDTDMDGIIYQTDLEGGTYSVKLVQLNGYETMYDFSQATKQSLAVKTQLDYQKVDVKNEIKSSTQVEATEDAAENDTVQESKLSDTVTYLMSEKSQSSNGYVAINKSSVADPVTALTAKYEASLFRFRRLSRPVNVEGEDASENNPCSHAYDKYTTNNDGTHKVECSLCGDVKEASEACDNSADTTVACTKCGYKVTAHTHTYDKYTKNDDGTHKVECSCGDVKEANAACDTSGADGACSKCGYKAAHTHTYDKFTKNDDGTHKVECSCGDVKEANAACDYTYTYTQNATESKHTRKGTCKVCGYVKTDVETACTDKGDGTCVCGRNLTATSLKIAAVSPSTTTVTCGDTASLKATITPALASGKTATYTWSVTTGKDEIISITSSADTAIVTGLKAGSANVHCEATVDGNKYVADCPITVSGPTIKFDRETKKVVFVDGDTFTVTATTTGGKTNKVVWSVSDTNLATITTTETATAEKGTSAVTIKGVKAGTVTVTATSQDGGKTVKKEISIIVMTHPKNDKETKLVDTEGNQVYVLDTSTNKYREAVYADYYTGVTLYKGSQITYTYKGWWTIDGKTYYFDSNGKKVTGDQVILGAKYSFDANGVLKSGTGSFGIDVSTWNGTIDWSKVAKSGVSFAIIRCGFRGTTAGGLVQDNKFETNMKNATSAGIKVGVYFFTQAITEAEAVEEASMCLQLVDGYKVNYPIFIDVENASNGRANKLSKDERTKIVNAFCKTITNAGYKAGIYANKTWFSNYMNVSELTGYTIWLAQYAASTSYTASRYDVWQYSSSGSINGISGNVDLNLSYLGY